MAKQTPQDKLLIGAHTSASGGSFNALNQGKEIGATTIQIFTSNQKQWNGRKIPQEEVDKWTQLKDEYNIQKIMSHSSYLINLASPKEDLRKKSLKAFEEEIQRCHLLDIAYLNFHPGAFTTSSLEEGLDNIVSSLLTLEKLVSNGPTRLLLESTAGQGTSIGHKFEHLGFIIDKVKSTLPIGVCIDTCHSFCAGYDIRDETSWEKTLLEFDKKIGIENLFAFHLNDSKHDLGQRKDRHENIGKGKIGIECFKYLVTNEKTRDLPKYLETPNGETMWKEEIQMLRDLAGNGI